MTRASVAWDELVTAATVGTGTRALPEAGFHPTTVTSGPAEDSATRLLDLAAMETAAMAVTVEPTSATPVPAAPVETGVIMKEPLARLLLQVSRVDRDLVRDLLADVAQHRLVLPPSVLPEFLELASDPRLGAILTTVVGERGRWLVALDAEWTELLPPVSAEVHLADLRRSDATAARDLLATEWSELLPPVSEEIRLADLRRSDPAAARDLLATEWASAAADDRVRLLAALEEGLALDDVSFLEAALRDRRAPVVVRASLLLARLCANQPLDDQPDFGRRMIARAGPLVRLVRSGLLRTPTLLVSAPESPDDGARGDGIMPSDGSLRGPRASWLEQILERTPLSIWSEHLRRPAAELVRLPVTGDFAGELHAGWRAAAVAQRDESWARALLRAQDTVDAPLLKVLPLTEQAAYARQVLHRAEPGDPAVLPVPAAIDGPWPGDLATAALTYLERLVSLPPSRETISLLRLLARRLPVRQSTLVETIDARMTTEDWAEQQARTVAFDSPWRPGLTMLSATLSLRARIDDELRRSAP